MTHHLLIVDDEPLNLEILSEYFDGQGYRLSMAENGEVAWAMLKQHPDVDLVLLDRMMPCIDGVELLKRIKADPELKPIPVIMQTAASAPEQVREGLLAGALYYLTKPYERDSLLSIVQMPAGIPVGTLAIGKAGAANAALLAAAVLALSDDALAARLDAWRAAQTARVALEPADAPAGSP